MANKLQFVDLVGKQFEWGGRGPDKFDCYGLVSEIFSRQGKQTPDYRSPAHRLHVAAVVMGVKHEWVECQEKPGVLALMQFGQYMHVAYVLDKYRIIHTWEKSGGVVIEPLNEWRKRIIGFYEFPGSDAA